MENDFPEFDEYNIEDEEETEETGASGEPRQPRRKHPLVMLLRMFVSPVKAWKDLCKYALASEKSAETFASKCFYPLIALATASNFMRMIYDPEIKLNAELVSALVVFLSFFIGYFLVFSVCKLILPEDAKEKIDSNFGRIYIMVGMSTLAIFLTIGEFLPDLDALLVFLPLFTVYISARGAKYLRIKEAGESVTGWMTALLEIFVPYAIYELFPLILPQI